jgi:Tfp pilus assembly protein PilV
MHQNLKIVKRFAGLTLIEVVIASALLAAAMVPILKCLTVAHSSAVKIEHKSRSLLLAQAKLNEIRARSIYNYTNGGAAGGFAETNTSLGGLYLCNVTDNKADPLKTVTVSVGFDSDGNAGLSADEVNITLATLIARRWSD